MGRDIESHEVGQGQPCLHAMTSRQTILNVVERQRDRVFLVDAFTDREIAYGDFHRQACNLASELRHRGLRKGDRIAVMVPNCCELVVLYFACIYLGAVIVPVNPALSKSDIRFILESCKPSFIVSSSVFAESLRGFDSQVLTLVTAQDKLETESDDRKLRIDFQSASSSPFSLKSTNLHSSNIDSNLDSSNDDDLAVIMYTSGTSAKPKGLAHKIGAMFRNASAFAAVQQIDQESRFYLSLSMSYMGGFFNLLILPFLCGASVVVDHVFDARSSLRFWEKAKRSQINTLWMAPTVLSILLRMDRGRQGEEFCRSSVRRAFVGFAPLPLKVKTEFETRYGVKLIENYGLSETLFVTARSREIDAGRGYVGESLPGVELQIVNDEGCLLPPGSEGEVQVLTPDLMAGYLDAKGQLLKTNASAWFPTGDLGVLNHDGSLFITGRKKDVIIRGGVNVSPAAIEESLMQISGVFDVAVVSIAHELYGEDIVAVLKLEPGVKLESLLDVLVAHAKDTLASHQQPARYLEIDEFPRTANGKVQKAQLRQLVAEKFHLSSRSSFSTALAEPAIASGQ